MSNIPKLQRFKWTPELQARLIHLWETRELIEWQRGKDVGAVVSALLITSAKVAVASAGSLELEMLLSLLSTAFNEECARRLN